MTVPPYKYTSWPKTPSPPLTHTHTLLPPPPRTDTQKHAKTQRATPIHKGCDPHMRTDLCTLAHKVPHPHHLCTLKYPASFISDSEKGVLFSVNPKMCVICTSTNLTYTAGGQTFREAARCVQQMNLVACCTADPACQYSVDTFRVISTGHYIFNMLKRTPIYYDKTQHENVRVKPLFQATKTTAVKR